MAKNKFYAIKKGLNPNTKEIVENLILDNWNEAKTYVTGVKGVNPEYKGFPTLELANEYLATSDPLQNKSEGKYPLKALHCYVDGSYNSAIPNYSYGLVCVDNGKVLHMDKGAGTNQDAIQMQQIGGELLGAIKALLFAKAKGYKEVVIFHDYKGVCYHAVGYWKRENAFSETYYSYMQDFFKNNPSIKVHFCKVDAHTGDEFNEIADGLAKEGVGLTPDKIYYKSLEKLGLKAS